MESVRINWFEFSENLRAFFSTARTSLVNGGFIIWVTKRELSPAGPTREIPSFPLGREANQNTGITSSCPLADSAV